jgi:hypothetical protein
MRLNAGVHETGSTPPASLQAKTVITGLTTGTTVDFRFRGVTKAGEGAYSQVVQILVS